MAFKQLLPAASVRGGVGGAQLALRVWEDVKGKLSYSTKSDDLRFFKTTAHITIFPLRTEQRINWIISSHLSFVSLVSFLVETGAQIWPEYSPSLQEDPDLRESCIVQKLGGAHQMALHQ